MTWSTPVIHASGDPLPVGDYNTLAYDLIQLATYVGTYDNGPNTLTGGTLPATGLPSTLLIPASFASAAVSSGQMSLTLPTPFPNQILACAMMPIDNVEVSLTMRSSLSSASTLVLNAWTGTTAYSGSTLSVTGFVAGY